MLFGKGGWSIIGVKNESLAEFQTLLADPKALFELSQLWASVLKVDGESIGINPFGNPRMDNRITSSEAVNLCHQKDTPDKVETDKFDEYYGSAPDQYKIHPDMPWYGFWVVFNSNEDVDDEKSKLEQVAYERTSRPYKFLVKDMKKGVEAQVTPINAGTRKQVPVLVDFNTQRVYIASTNKEEVGSILILLDDLKLETFGLCWDFGEPDWVQYFLDKIVSETKDKYWAEMVKRAKDVQRLGEDAQEKLEDKELESVVSNYFATAELPSGQWASLFPNTAIKLYDGGDAVTASSAASAVTLLDICKDAYPTQAGVMFQEMDSRFVKKTGEEKLVRTDVYSFDLNEGWAISDLSVAAIRGFDIPNFKKEIKHQLRKTKQEYPISYYWSEWLRQMNEGIHVLVDNVNLALDSKGGGLVSYGENTEKKVQVAEA